MPPGGWGFPPTHQLPLHCMAQAPFQCTTVPYGVIGTGVVMTSYIAQQMWRVGGCAALSPERPPNLLAAGVVTTVVKTSAADLFAQTVSRGNSSMTLVPVPENSKWAAAGGWSRSTSLTTPAPGWHTKVHGQQTLQPHCDGCLVLCYAGHREAEVGGGGLEAPWHVLHLWPLLPGRWRHWKHRAAIRTQTPVAEEAAAGLATAAEGCHGCPVLSAEAAGMRIYGMPTGDNPACHL